MLEFFPGKSSRRTLVTAVQVMEAAGRTETGILVDTLHFNRSGSKVEQLHNIPGSRLPFVHVCDATVQDTYTTEELLHTGRAERLPPGEGGIDIRGILRHMPPGIPVALEVPMTAMSAAQGAEAVARRVRQAAGRVLTGGLTWSYRGETKPMLDGGWRYAHPGDNTCRQDGSPDGRAGPAVLNLEVGMIIRTLDDVTTAALAVMERTQDPRLREIMISLVTHLHGFVREVRLTEAEFREATAILNEIGKLTPIP